MSKVPVVKFNNGLSCPILGLGTYLSQPNEVGEAVKNAIDAGYRHIDCARSYKNEKEIGAALKEKFDAGVIKREDIFITSKLWNSFHRPDLVEVALRQCLSELGLEYLDMYLIHWPQAFKEGGDLFPRDSEDKVIYSDVDYVDTWKAMEEMVRKGLTKSIGISNFNRKQIERVLEVATIKPVVNQVEIHPYLNQQKMYDYCKSVGIAMMAFSPLCAPYRPPETKLTNLLKEEKLKRLGEKYNKTPAQICIRYAIERNIILIPKSVTKSRIYENFNVFDFKLTSDDMKLIASLECNGRCCMLGDHDHKDYPFHEEY